MPPSRNRTTYSTDWINPFTGEVHRLGIRHTRDYLGQGQDHLEIETAKSESRRDHPLSATGYLSHFIRSVDLINAGGPVTFVDAWITRSLASKEWCQADQKKRQGRPKAKRPAAGAFAGLVSEQLPPQARASSRCFSVGSFLIAFPVLASAKRSSYRL